MIKINKKTLIIIITIIATALIIAYMLFTKNNDETITNLEEIETNENDTQNNQKETNENKIIIHITGAIKKEGIYELKENSRIADAIEAAEGLTENANIQDINLAYVLEDGEKIHIPTKEEIKQRNNETTEKNADKTTIYVTKNTGGTEKSASNTEKNTGNTNNSGNAKNNNSTTNKNEKININTATQAELETLPGIGPSTALKIINYRKENGKYKTIEDIKKVSGIGDSKYNKIKELIKI